MVLCHVHQLSDHPIVCTTPATTKNNYNEMDFTKMPLNFFRICLLVLCGSKSVVCVIKVGCHSVTCVSLAVGDTANQKLNNELLSCLNLQVRVKNVKGLVGDSGFIWG